MSIAPSNPPQDRDAWFSGLARRTREAALVFAIVGVLFVLVPILVGIKYRADYLSVCIWGAAVAILAWAGAFWLLVRGNDGEPLEADEARVFALIMGGVFGFLTTFLGFLLGWKWLDTFVSWVNGEGQDGWKILLVLIAIVGGLAVMFASLQLGRSQERSNSTLRLVVYGYNAVLGGLLLLAILIVANVLVYLKFPAYADFTSESIYTLSSRSKSILSGLQKPTKIYAIFSAGDPIGSEVDTLLSDFREVNDKIQVRKLSPDFDEEARQLARTFGILDREGILITYGSEPQIEHHFIKRADLFSLNMDRMGRQNPDEKESFKFKGEDALITELNFLAENKDKPVIYFTQGNGELDLKKMDFGRADDGAGVLKERLEKRNFQVRPLNFKPGEAVPPEAEIVVMAGPSQPLPEFALKALHDYMNPADPAKRKGKLMILVGVDTTRDNKMKQTGLDGLLAEFSVQATNERILSVPRPPQVRSPMQVLITVNGDIAPKNPIAAAFLRTGFILENVRIIRPSAEAPGRPNAGRYTADTLFETASYAWSESNLSGDVLQIFADLRKDAKLFQQKLSEGPLSVAVAVSEPAPFNPADPHAAMRAPEGKPRMIVFGCSTMASNQHVSEQGNRGEFEVLSSCLDWLRERPNSIGIEAKKREFYAVAPTAGLAKMVLLPGLLAAIAIVGLGTGVWVVRRR